MKKVGLHNTQKTNSQKCHAFFFKSKKPKNFEGCDPEVGNYDKKVNL